MVTKWKRNHPPALYALMIDENHNALADLFQRYDALARNNNTDRLDFIECTWMSDVVLIRHAIQSVEHCLSFRGFVSANTLFHNDTFLRPFGNTEAYFYPQNLLQEWQHIPNQSIGAPHYTNVVYNNNLTPRNIE
jgi:hypothetical protein